MANEQRCADVRMIAAMQSLSSKRCAKGLNSVLDPHLHRAFILVWQGAAE